MCEAAIYLDELLSQLAEIDQEIISLKFQGHNSEEIAAILDMPSNTIRSRYSRAVKRLQQIDSSLVNAVKSLLTTDQR